MLTQHPRKRQALQFGKWFGFASEGFGPRAVGNGMKTGGEGGIVLRRWARVVQNKR
jgi:hypothetical protein